jgi:FKBP-type peptidyl-prolyl cis-trans isomerase (trigger factor)
MNRPPDGKLITANLSIESHLLDTYRSIIKKKTSEVKTMVKIDFDTYQMICDLLIEVTDDELTYSIEEIAEMIGTSVEAVQYVDEAENGAF